VVVTRVDAVWQGTKPRVDFCGVEPMLRAVLVTKQLAADTYRNGRRLVQDDEELYDLIDHICFAEVRSVEEPTQLM